MVGCLIDGGRSVPAHVVLSAAGSFDSGPRPSPRMTGQGEWSFRQRLDKALEVVGVVERRAVAEEDEAGAEAEELPG